MSRAHCSGEHMQRCAADGIDRARAETLPRDYYADRSDDDAGELLCEPPTAAASRRDLGTASEMLAREFKA